MPKVSRAARRLSAEPVPTSKSRESEAAMPKSGNAKIFDIGITAVARVLSVGVMPYAVVHFGLQEAWPELVLNHETHDYLYMSANSHFSNT